MCHWWGESTLPLGFQSLLLLRWWKDLQVVIISNLTCMPGYALISSWWMAGDLTVLSPSPVRYEIRWWVTSSRGTASSRDVSCLVSPTGSTAEGPHRPALLSGCQQTAETAHCRAREQKQVRDDCLGDAVQIFSLCLFSSFFLFHNQKFTLRIKEFLVWQNKHTSKHIYYWKLLLLLLWLLTKVWYFITKY